jgi:hypothetical protein
MEEPPAARGNGQACPPVPLEDPNDSRRQPFRASGARRAAMKSGSFMTTHQALTFLAVLAFAGIHIVPRLGVIFGGLPRNVWLSTAGGVSVAYVFVHLLPELASHQATFRDHAAAGSGLLASIERHTYLIALAGLTLFYGLDQLAHRSAASERRARREARPSIGTFWVHLGAFAVYNMLVGYLVLHRREDDLRGLLLYAIALGLHFLVNDQSLREHHGALYDRIGRWILAAAPLLGWAAGFAVSLSPLAVAALFALLAGGVVLNVLKEELPPERESRFWAFAAGAAIYSVLLLFNGDAASAVR